jgi:hypothetical protein
VVASGCPRWWPPKKSPHLRLTIHPGSPFGRSRWPCFSKVVAPGLRLGWVTPHPQLVAAMAAVRDDLGASGGEASPAGPASGSSATRPAAQHLRLSFIMVPIDVIPTGVAVLGDAIASAK